MRIIDPHVHVFKADPRYPWAPETTHPPAEDATPEMLLELMAANGVERTVLVQVIHYRWDNRFVADTLKRYPKEFMGVARVNPQDPAAPDHLSRLVEVDGFRGVRLSPGADASGDWFTGPLMDPIFSRASRLGVPMCILTKPSRLPDLARLIERHPDLDVVIDHMADAGLGNAADLAQLTALARYPRVYVKISHTWSISKEAFPWRDTHSMVQAVYEAFSGPRIMFGTDWPVCLRETTYDKTLAVVRDHMDFIAPEDREWVLGRTALRIWPFE
jgi:predicted TIM-barrel fold metal-dependent hydrolase